LAPQSLCEAAIPQRSESESVVWSSTSGAGWATPLSSKPARRLYYSYCIRGVQYEASQDITTLRDYLPSEPERLIGVATLKYATNNPANSILICEEWSGVRPPAQTASESSVGS